MQKIYFICIVFILTGSVASMENRFPIDKSQVKSINQTKDSRRIVYRADLSNDYCIVATKFLSSGDIIVTSKVLTSSDIIFGSLLQPSYYNVLENMYKQQFSQ